MDSSNTNDKNLQQISSCQPSKQTNWLILAMNIFTGMAQLVPDDFTTTQSSYIGAWGWRSKSDLCISHNIAISCKRQLHPYFKHCLFLTDSCCHFTLRAVLYTQPGKTDNILPPSIHSHQDTEKHQSMPKKLIYPDNSQVITTNLHTLKWFVVPSTSQGHTISRILKVQK